MMLGPAFEEEERPLGPASEPNGREERKSIASRAFRTFEGDSDNRFFVHVRRSLDRSRTTIIGLDVD